MMTREAIDPDDTPLAERLRERVRREGPLSFREWMRAALYDPREGYYCRAGRARWGRAGDYRTSPERAPLFAATFASYFAMLYEELGEPGGWTIFEAGAGAGDFARGALETLRRDHKNVFAATRYLIDEAGAGTRESLRAKLGEFGGRVEFVRLDELAGPIETGIVFSNELLDALPVHRVTMIRGELKELCVGLSETGEFVWIACEPTRDGLDSFLRNIGARLEEGQVADINLEAPEWITKVARKLRRGFVITVDYGAEAAELYSFERRPAGTLRAFRRHRLAENVLAAPGEQDLTTTVDWTAIQMAGSRHGLETVSLERQDKFLLRAGLLEQLERLTERARDDAERLTLATSAREMILPGGMGESFQVLVQRKCDISN